MLFIPNATCTVTRPGGHDRYGQALPGKKTTGVRCAYVKVEPRSMKTTVRADSSASRGNAREVVIEVKVLFHPAFEPKLDDLVEVTIRGTTTTLKLRAEMVFPRTTVSGRLHHFEVDCSAVAEIPA